MEVNGNLEFPAGVKIHQACSLWTETFVIKSAESHSGLQNKSSWFNKKKKTTYKEFIKCNVNAEKYLN